MIRGFVRLMFGAAMVAGFLTLAGYAPVLLAVLLWAALIVVSLLSRRRLTHRPHPMRRGVTGTP